MDYKIDVKMIKKNNKIKWKHKIIFENGQSIEFISDNIILKIEKIMRESKL